MVPTLPINIEAMITILPIVDNWGVTPVLKPTVEKADTCSNNKSRLSCLGSVTDKIKTPNRIYAAAKLITENALKSVSIGIVRLSIDIIFLPRIVDTTETAMSRKVIVFIPPPVEPGDAPINIRKIIIMSVGFCSLVKSTVLNPAVRVMTD
jgi:hypothetical protein